MYDVVIIGQGPAGISCAIYLKRYNINPLVIAKDLGTLEIDTTIENYYGIQSIKGRDLINNGIKQAKELGVEIINEEVLDIVSYPSLEVITKNNKYQAKSIFLALGKSKEKVFIKGLKEFEGKGVSYCATCDGFFYRNKKIGIIGSGDYMLLELEVLKNLSKDIYVFSDKEMAIEGVNVINEELVEVYGEDVLKGVKTTKNDYKLDALFVALGSQTGLTFAKHLGLFLDDKNNIVVNNYMTNIDGIFAGGDVIGGLPQIVKAASDGANAALEIKKYLKDKSK